MLKNTYYLILFLSVLAALVIGLNIGKKIQQPTINNETIQQSEISLTPTPPTIDSEPIQSSTSSSINKSASPSGVVLKNGLYTSASCAVSFAVPATIDIEESATDAKGAVFTNKTNPTDMMVLTCQKDIPRPPLTSQNIENFSIGTVAGKLYHDSSQKDGTKVDALIFTHPKTKLDVFLGGYGSTFNTLIQSLKIL
jgi:hypothetical protein